MGTQNGETRLCGLIQGSQEGAKYLCSGMPSSVENALSSSLSELSEGPPGASSWLVRGCRSEGHSLPLALQNFLYLALFSVCPAGGCSFTPRKLGKCKDCTEMVSEGHFEENFCFSWCWYSVRFSQLGAGQTWEGVNVVLWKTSPQPPGNTLETPRCAISPGT